MDFVIRLTREMGTIIAAPVHAGSRQTFYHSDRESLSESTPW